MPTSKRQNQERFITRLKNIKKFIEKHRYERHGLYYQYERCLDELYEIIYFEKSELKLMKKKRVGNNG